MVQMLNVQYGHKKSAINSMGMREMQARAYSARAAQFLLLKAPPASGKSRALMFIALDKLRHQALRKVIVCVPETSIGGSFRTTDLRSFGFEADWVVHNKWNLCLTGENASDKKVNDFFSFMRSDAEVMVCTHATFRFGYDKVVQEEGPEAFDECLIAIDEFHHVSASDNNRLGVILRALVARGKCHLMAMTGSYFRGDADPILRPEDETKFTPVIYSYYEQLEGYKHLKALGVNYQFYKGNYINGLESFLDTTQKTIIHIPHRGSSEAFDDKFNEVGKIIDLIGTHVGREEATGFDLVKTGDGRLLKVADLVDDGPGRDVVKSALMREIKGPDGQRDDEMDRAKVDIIIALGMAKEGFDWVWCDHALTIGYRSSLTEIVQIIGRATRDAPHKTKALFTNLVAEPGVETGVVTDAVNDMLKAISGSLLMEQVLAPNFQFYRREDNDIREPVTVNGEGNLMIGVRGLIEPPTDRSREICEQDMHELMAATCQAIDRRVLLPGTAPEVATQTIMADIIEARYEMLDDEETESIRQHLSAQMNILSLARRHDEDDTSEGQQTFDETPMPVDSCEGNNGLSDAPNTLLQLVSKFINVRDIDVELIDSVNAFKERFEVASKTLDSKILAHIQSALVATRINMSEGEARSLWPRIKAFREIEGREPNLNSADALEKRMAEALSWLKAQKAKRLREGTL